MERAKVLEKILETGCNGNCDSCKLRKECEEFEKLQHEEKKRYF